MDSLVVTTALIEAALVAAALSVVFTTTLVFVPKNATAARLCAVAAMAGLTRLFYIPLWKVFTRPAYRANFDSLTCVAFMNSAEIVFVSRVDAMELSGGKGHPQVDTVTLFWRAMCLLCNWRRAGTRWEIPNLKWRGPRSRARFLATILAKLSLAYLIMDAIDSAELPEVHFFAEEKQTLFRFWKLSSEDIVFRTFATIGLWVSSLLFNYMNNTSVAFLSVLTGLSKPEAWPYVNGSLSAIYTVRGFWSNFWHQLLRKALTGWADFTSDKILRLRRGTLLSRYTRIFLAFFLSGLMHFPMDRAFGLRYSDLASVRFFSIQALGVMVEDGVQAATAGLAIPPRVRRLVGYVWVVVFLWWSTPTWFYPSARVGDPGGVVPFSFVRMAWT